LQFASAPKVVFTGSLKSLLHPSFWRIFRDTAPFVGYSPSSRLASQKIRAKWQAQKNPKQALRRHNTNGFNR